MEKTTKIVILKALIQILFYLDRLRHHIPEHNKAYPLEETRKELYAEIRRLNKPELLENRQ